jgi:hypothetical protein
MKNNIVAVSTVLATIVICESEFNEPHLQSANIEQPHVEVRLEIPETVNFTFAVAPSGQQVAEHSADAFITLPPAHLSSGPSPVAKRWSPPLRQRKFELPVAPGYWRVCNSREFICRRAIRTPKKV